MPGFPGNSLFEGPSLQAALLEVIVPYISCWRFSPVSLPAFWHGLRRRRGRAATRDLKDQVFLGFVNNEVQLCWWLNRNWPLDFRHCSCQGCWESYSFPRFRWFDKPDFGFCLYKPSPPDYAWQYTHIFTRTMFVCANDGTNTGKFHGWWQKNNFRIVLLIQPDQCPFSSWFGGLLWRETLVKNGSTLGQKSSIYKEIGETKCPKVFWIWKYFWKKPSDLDITQQIQ